jgi:hypothetical protein
MKRRWGITPMEGKRNSYKFLLWSLEDKAAPSLHRRRLKGVKKVKDVRVHGLKAQRGDWSYILTRMQAGHKTTMRVKPTPQSLYTRE